MTQYLGNLESNVMQREESYKAIKEHNEQMVKKIRDQIADCVSRGRDHADLDKQLDQALAMSKSSEERSQNNLQIAREALTKAKEKAAEVLKAKAAAIDEKRKTAARLAWLGNGGDPAEFENAWVTTIRAELLKNSVMDDLINQERAQKQGRSFGSF